MPQLYPPCPFPMNHPIGIGDYVIASDVMDYGMVLGYSDRLDKFRAFRPDEVIDDNNAMREVPQ